MKLDYLGDEGRRLSLFSQIVYIYSPTFASMVHMWYIFFKKFFPFSILFLRAYRILKAATVF